VGLPDIHVIAAGSEPSGKGRDWLEEL